MMNKGYKMMPYLKKKFTGLKTNSLIYRNIKKFLHRLNTAG